MENVIENLKTNTIYKELKKVEFNHEVEEVMEELKEKYLTIFHKKNFYDMFFNTEFADKERHAEQSETLGKLVVLTHEFKGYKGVMDTLNTILWKYNELVQESTEAYEREIEELNSKLKKQES
ncbi:MAG: hypothetical protein ACRC0S_08045 [Fusobacteriaceae bacterium]